MSITQDSGDLGDKPQEVQGKAARIEAVATRMKALDRKMKRLVEQRQALDAEMAQLFSELDWSEYVNVATGVSVLRTSAIRRVYDLPRCAVVLGDQVHKIIAEVDDRAFDRLAVDNHRLQLCVRMERGPGDIIVNSRRF